MRNRYNVSALAYGHLDSWCNSHRPELVAKDLERTLKELNTDYLDLYLIHWPTHFMPGETMSATKKTEDGKEEVVIDTECPSIGETWKEMVKLLDTGKVKAVRIFSSVCLLPCVHTRARRSAFPTLPSSTLRSSPKLRPSSRTCLSQRRVYQD